MLQLVAAGPAEGDRLGDARQSAVGSFVVVEECDVVDLGGKIAASGDQFVDEAAVTVGICSLMHYFAVGGRQEVGEKGA